MKNIEPILWHNMNMATLSDGRYNIVEDAAIVTQQDTILWLGSLQDLPEEYHDIDQEQDLDQCFVTPGLIDCHTHLVYAGNRATEFEMRLQGKSYADIANAGGGILSTVAATRHASENELYDQSAKRMIAMQQQGVTTIEIKSGYGLSLDSELKMLRVAKQLAEQFPVTIIPTFLGAHTVPPEYTQNPEAYVDVVCNEMIPAVCKDQLAQNIDVFCEHIAFNLAQTRKVFECAKAHGLNIKCHADQLSNLGATQLAAEFKALSVDHLEFASAECLHAMAKADTTAVLLPGAYYFLKEKQMPPINAMQELNIPMAIATDCNPGSSPTTSLLLMLNMSCLLFGLTPEQALAGATVHAAKALGLQQTHGHLAVNYKADFALWDINHPAELAYNIGSNPCIGIVKNGQLYCLGE